MSELDRFTRIPYEKELTTRMWDKEKKEEVDYTRKWKFKALGPKELPLFLSMQDIKDKGKMAEAINQLILKYTKDNIPDATEEQVETLFEDPKFLNEFMNCVYLANGMTGEKKKELEKEMIEKGIIKSGK